MQNLLYHGLRQGRTMFPLATTHSSEQLKHDEHTLPLRIGGMDRRRGCGFRGPASGPIRLCAYARLRRCASTCAARTWFIPSILHLNLCEGMLWIATVAASAGSGEGAWTFGVRSNTPRAFCTSPAIIAINSVSLPYMQSIEEDLVQKAPIKNYRRKGSLQNGFGFCRRCVSHE